MAKRQTAKERREESRARTLANRMDKANRKITKPKTEELEPEIDEQKVNPLPEDFTVEPDYSDYVPSFDGPYSGKKESETTIKYKDDGDLSELRKIFEKNRRNKNWQKKMPKHEEFEVPEFLTNSSLKDERSKIAEKLQELFKTKFSLSDIADILLYNDYDSLDDILKNKKEFLNAIKEQYPTFAFQFKKKVGADNSRLYSAQEKRIKALIDFLAEGSFTKTGSVHAFQDAVSSVVDMPAFNTACQLESEFIDNEIQLFIENLEEKEDKSHELYELRDKAMAIRYELQYRTDAFKTISELINGKSKEEPDIGR